LRSKNPSKPNPFKLPKAQGMAQPDQALSVTLGTQWLFAKQKSIKTKTHSNYQKPRDGAARPGFVCDSGDAMALCEAKIQKLPKKEKVSEGSTFETLFHLHTICILVLI
jgi:hypothetical protein